MTSLEQYRRIKNYLDLGLSYAAIARKTGLSVSYVSTIARKWSVMPRRYDSKPQYREIPHLEETVARLRKEGKSAEDIFAYFGLKGTSASATHRKIRELMEKYPKYGVQGYRKCKYCGFIGAEKHFVPGRNVCKPCRAQYRGTLEP